MGFNGTNAETLRQSQKSELTQDDLGAIEILPEGTRKVIFGWSKTRHRVDKAVFFVLFFIGLGFGQVKEADQIDLFSYDKMKRMVLDYCFKESLSDQLCQVKIDQLPTFGKVSVLIHRSGEHFVADQEIKIWSGGKVVQTCRNWSRGSWYRDRRYIFTASCALGQASDSATIGTIPRF